MLPLFFILFCQTNYFIRRRIIRSTTTNQTGNDHHRGTWSSHEPAGRTHRPTPERCTTGKYEGRSHWEETTEQNEGRSLAALKNDLLLC